MGKVKTISLLGGFWELVRIYLFFIILLNWLGSPSNPGDYFLHLWIGSTQMVFALLFFSLGFSRYNPTFSIRILLIYKILSLFSGILFFMNTLLPFGFLKDNKAVGSVLLNLQFNLAKPSFLLAGIVLLIDLIFLLSLILYKKRIVVPVKDLEQDLPDYEETTLEE